MSKLGMLIYRAIERNDANWLEELLTSEPEEDVSSYNEGPHSALTAACAGDQDSLVSKLLDDGRFNPNYAPQNGLTPLQWSAWLDSGGAATELLSDRRTKINARNRYGRTALFYAISANSLHVLKLLLELDQEPDRTERLDFTTGEAFDENLDFLTKPSEHTKLKVLEALNGKPIPGLEWLESSFLPVTPAEKFRHACARGEDEVVADLIKKWQRDPEFDIGCDEQDGDGATPLMLACWEGHLSAVRHLLKICSGNIQDRLGRTAVYYAAAGNNVQIVSAMLEAVWYVRIGEQGSVCVTLRAMYTIDPSIPDKWGRLPREADIESIFRAGEEVQRMLDNAVKEREESEKREIEKEQARSGRGERANKRSAIRERPTEKVV